MPNTILAADIGLPISLTVADVPRAFPDFSWPGLLSAQPDSALSDPEAQLVTELGMNAVLVALTALLNDGGANV